MLNCFSGTVSIIMERLEKRWYASNRSTNKFDINVRNYGRKQ